MAKKAVKAKKAKEARTLSVDALRVQQGTSSFFLFSLKASILFKITEINQRSEDKQEGYQRALSPARVRSVEKYVNAGGLLPGSIVVSFDDGAFDPNTGKLTIPNRRNVGWVIDGQHRLAGAHEASDGGVDVSLPVIGFLQLSVEKQVELFITINKEARGVPASLYIDLLKNLPKRKTDRELTDERIADIARALGNDEQSPFNQKIIFTRTARAGEISLNNFARILRPHLARPAGTISLYTPSTQEGVIGNYFKALQASFPAAFKKDPPIFFRTVGFGAVWRAFPHVFGLTQAKHKSFNVASIAKIFAEISDFDFDQWNQSGSGTSAEIAAGDDLIAALDSAYADEDGSSLPLKLD